MTEIPPASSIRIIIDVPERGSPETIVTNVSTAADIHGSP
jgi:hypothetical protein